MHTVSSSMPQSLHLILAQSSGPATLTAGQLGHVGPMRPACQLPTPHPCPNGRHPPLHTHHHSRGGNLRQAIGADDLQLMVALATADLGAHLRLVNADSTIAVRAICIGHLRPAFLDSHSARLSAQRSRAVYHSLNGRKVSNQWDSGKASVYAWDDHLRTWRHRAHRELPPPGPTVRIEQPGQ
jgi:hypothetical protein